MTGLTRPLLPPQMLFVFSSHFFVVFSPLMPRDDPSFLQNLVSDNDPISLCGGGGVGGRAEEGEGLMMRRAT